VVHIEGKDRDVTGISLSAALGFGVGLVGEIFLREFLGRVNTDPVKKAVRRLNAPEGESKKERAAIEDGVIQAWEDDPDLRPLPLAVEALGDGIIEITGKAASPMTRQLASDVARSVPGAEVVLNRIHLAESSGDDSEPELAPETG
jgi:hypothetical protein